MAAICSYGIYLRLLDAVPLAVILDPYLALPTPSIALFTTTISRHPEIMLGVLVTIRWAVVAVVGILWSFVWFLISGWVSTLLQIAVLIATIYFLKYGWQRAPAEILRRNRSFGRFFWSWLRAHEPQTNSDVHV